MCSGFQELLLLPMGDLDRIDRLACNAEHAQECVLSDILTRNAHTEYLRSLGLGDGKASPQTFKCVAPLITYSDVKPLIMRIVNGDRSPILTAQPISLLLLSSGTSSGEAKFIPTQDDDLRRREQVGLSLPSALLARAWQEAGLNVHEENATLDLHFLFLKPEFTTPGGLQVRSLLTHLCKGEAFRAHAQTASPSPLEVLLSADLSQSMYCQLLCGLIRRSEVGFVTSIFPPVLLRVMQFLEEQWQELVQDIRTGTLSKSRVSDPTVRASVEALIAALGGPNPVLAEEVERECQRQPKWQGIVQRLWPKAKAVATIVTGSMSQYVPMLEFYTGGLPLVTSAYASSEGVLGVNLTPLCPPSDISYMLLPDMAYFEFLPVFPDGNVQSATVQQHDQAAQSSSSSKLVDLVNVKLGEDYELVITTFAGLYRYRVGDVLRVTGFHKKAPLFRFVRRVSVLLSIDADKTDEETLQKAVAAATLVHLDPMGWHVVDYTSYADICSTPGHYVLFLELQRELGERLASQEAAALVDPTDLQACCLEMEENLDIIYKRGRVCEKSIGPLEIRVVQMGTFSAIMEELCVHQEPMRGSSISQYKTPRCVNNQQLAPILELLNSRVSISAFSPQCPSFALLP